MRPASLWQEHGVDDVDDGGADCDVGSDDGGHHAAGGGEGDTLVGDGDGELAAGEGRHDHTVGEVTGEDCAVNDVEGEDLHAAQLVSDESRGAGVRGQHVNVARLRRDLERVGWMLGCMCAYQWWAPS